MVVTSAELLRRLYMMAKIAAAMSVARTATTTAAVATSFELSSLELPAPTTRSWAGVGLADGVGLTVVGGCDGLSVSGTPVVEADGELLGAAVGAVVGAVVGVAVEPTLDVAPLLTTPARTWIGLAMMCSAAAWTAAALTCAPAPCVRAARREVTWVLRIRQRLVSVSLTMIRGYPPSTALRSRKALV
jgi:hypothetical protein